MNRKKTLIIVLTIIQAFFFLSCKEKSMDGKIIFTRISGRASLISTLPATASQLIAIAQDGSDLEVLTKDFFSAISPDISYDGYDMLFAGRHKSEDSWEIYEMNLKNRQVRKVTSLAEDCLYPSYLPTGEIVFSRLNENDSLKSSSALYTCKKDGSDLKRITFNPDSYSYSTVLKDGRILSLVSETPESINSTTAHQHLSTSYMVMKPDGTKSELFYNGGIPRGKAFETTAGTLVFIESSANDSVRNISSINYNDPLSTHNNLTAGLQGDFVAVFPLTSEKVLVSYNPSKSSQNGLYALDQKAKVVGKPIYASNEYTISDITFVTKHTRPRKLPSEVDASIKTGMLLCQNVNEWRLNYENHPQIAESIEVLGLNSSLGLVPVEKDGSFFLKVKADTPFKIRMLDSKGNVLEHNCNWIWLRPNERRGCVGCHEDPAEVPENKVPMAVKKQPAEIPVQVSGYHEKSLASE
jgi:hypothetical protein